MRLNSALLLTVSGTRLWTLRASEFALLFLAFFWQGAWPVPDVNEPYYLGKAVHFWNPQWCPRDDFFATGDAHLVFYVTFGWLSVLLPLPALAWTGRVLTWALLAAAWCFLGRRLRLEGVPLVLAGILFAAFQERLAMAGEWVIGGVEAKGFAYGLVLFALGTLASGRWQRTFILLGLATAFHVLVGGWSLLGVAVVGLMQKDRPPMRDLIPALVVALLFALPGLLPSLALTWDVSPEILREAHRIYTFERLAHHLVPGAFRPEDVIKFCGLSAAFLCASQFCRGDGAWQQIRRFVVASLLIAMCGWVLSWTIPVCPEFAAAVLRYYWFRLADVAVPLGMALWLGLGAAGRVAIPRGVRSGVTPLMTVLCVLHLASYLPARLGTTLPRSEWIGSGWVAWPSDSLAQEDFRQWRQVCRWVAVHTPPEARFFTPITKSTFKWYTGRSEVVTWKEIPQDAISIVTWWKKIKDIYVIEDPLRGPRWVRSLSELPEDRVLALAEKYGVDYILTYREPPLALEVAFARPDNAYVVYYPRRAARSNPADQPCNRNSP